mgnify:CR=1 FL=1
MTDRKDNSGALFKAGTKRDARDRDYNGQVMVAGVEYWVSGYINVAPKTGETYVGLTFKAKQDKPATKPTPESNWLDEPKPPSGPGGGDLDDDVPF